MDAIHENPLAGTRQRLWRKESLKLWRESTVSPLALKRGALPEEVNPHVAGTMCLPAGSAVTMGIVAMGATLKLSVQFSSPSSIPRVSATFLGSPFRTKRPHMGQSNEGRRCMGELLSMIIGSDRPDRIKSFRTIGGQK